MRPRRATGGTCRAAAALCIAAGIGLGGCGKAPPRTSTEVEAVRVDALPGGPADAVWSGAPVYDAPLILQDLVEPRLSAASTRQVRVQALTDGAEIAFRLTWADSTRDEIPKPSQFADACAIQLPRKTEPDLPAPQMGELDRAVEIVYWSAFWQSAANGRGDSIEALYPAAHVDHYPFEAPALVAGSDDQEAMARRYAPARALNNMMARPAGGSAVQDLIAEGPGTLTPAAATTSRGGGIRTAVGWDVMLARPLPEELRARGRSQIAFAVWDGARDEVGARKMRSVWIPISMEAKP